MSRSSAKKNAFQEAIRASLQKLVDSGETVSKKVVIDNAFFKNGSPVGKKTLYGRNANTKELVHADLQREIEAAMDAQKRRSGGKSRAETVSGLRESLSELKRENARLVDQVVEQEAQLLSALSDNGGKKHVVATQEMEIYVLSKVLDSLTSGAIGEVKNTVLRYERKYTSEELRGAKREIENYLREIRQSRFVGIEALKEV